MHEPTCEDLFEEDGYESVHRDVDDSWRHGAYIGEVFKRESDGTYWLAAYCLSSDGETHGLREGDADITQVKPIEATTIKYIPASQDHG